MYGIHDFGFIDRKDELQYVEELKKKNFFFLVKGRRRIGKTRLVYEAFDNFIYVFIWPDKSLPWILDRISEEHGIPLFSKFSDMLNYLLDTGKTIVFDEFQNLFNIDKSLLGEVQHIIDSRKRNRNPLRFTVLGSSYTMIKKVFQDYSSPLYGRLSDMITLDYLPVLPLFQTLDISLEDFIKLWSVFEGVPYYYEFMDFKKTPEENIIQLVLQRHSPLQEEGKALVSMEFGQESKIYTTILSSIAWGKTKLGEISSVFGEKASNTVKYLDTLRKDFNLVKRETPILENPSKSKNGIYEIRDNFLTFWYYFVDKRRDYIEQERFSELAAHFNRDFAAFTGRRFEKFILGLIKEGIIDLGGNIDKMGRQWGKIASKARRDQEVRVYEIDILLENSKDSTLYLGECKWKDNVNAAAVVSDLRRKREFLPESCRGFKKEQYLVFARSFSRTIHQVDGQAVQCFSLARLEEILKKKI